VRSTDPSIGFEPHLVFGDLSIHGRGVDWQIFEPRSLARPFLPIELARRWRRQEQYVCVSLLAELCHAVEGLIGFVDKQLGDFHSVTMGVVGYPDEHLESLVKI
jgi:hypothetical protein